MHLIEYKLISIFQKNKPNYAINKKHLHINKKEVFKMAYSERELLARIIQCEAGRRRRQWNESCCNSYYEQS